MLFRISQDPTEIALLVFDLGTMVLDYASDYVSCCFASDGLPPANSTLDAGRTKTR